MSELRMCVCMCVCVQYTYMIYILQSSINHIYTHTVHAYICIYIIHTYIIHNYNKHDIHVYMQTYIHTYTYNACASVLPVPFFLWRC